MIYSTPEFFFLLLPLAVVGTQIADSKGRKLILLAASFVFISWAGWFTTSLLIFTALLIYAAVRFSVALPRMRTTLIAGATLILIINLGIWKYWPWFATQLGMSDDTVARFVAAQGIPIGISFYTFQGIAYLIDFHKGQALAVTFLDFLLFKSFFAQLIAGPIVRYRELMPQVFAPRRATGADLTEGLELFALGMFKKLVLADQSASFVDPVFANVGGHSSGIILCAVLLYTVQVYGDFSGYIDMGRGAARMCGINLPENFQAPYLSTSIRDFWRRWHITLGRWLRDYVYFPLGGSRKGFGRGLVNLALTMALCGLWHGAAWNFVIWGIYHGILMIIERVSIQRFGLFLPSFLSIPLTLFLVIIGWILFRAERLSDISLIFHAFATIPFVGIGLPLRATFVTTVLFAIVVLIQFFETHGKYLRTIYFEQPAFVRGLATGCLLMTALALRGAEAPFIYFAF